MMPLKDMNVDEQLIEQTKRYFSGPVNFQDLRNKSVTVAPIPAIMDPLLSMLEHVAKEDKTQAFSSLRKEAHTLQIEEDKKQGEADIAQGFTYLQRITQLNRKINDHRDRLLLNRQSLVQVNLYQPYYHERGMMYHNGIQLQMEIGRLERERSQMQTELASVERQQYELSNRVDERHHRLTVRLSSPQTLQNAALTRHNADALENRIQAASKAIDADLSQKQQRAGEICHRVFLDALGNRLNGLPMSVEEKAALGRINDKMKAHHDDIAIAHQKATDFHHADTLLNGALGRQETLTSLCANLAAENLRLEARNRFLALELEDLSARRAIQVSLRNQFGIATLATSGAALAGTILGYFLLSAGLLALAPIVPFILLGVVAAVVTTLIVLLSIAGIRALSLKSDIAGKEQEKVTNTEKMSANSTKMASIRDRELPQLERAIPVYRAVVMETHDVYDNALAQMNGSLAEARSIDLPLVTLGFGGYGGSFFPVAPSAPPAEQLSTAPGFH